MAYLNLYPPVINTYMPAFINTGNCKVYFSLSPYNNFQDIKYAQISISYQNSNLSALRKEYKNEIKICDISVDNNIKNSNQKYYVTIDARDLADEMFAINTYYKVQIRFTHSNADTISNKKEGLNAYEDTASWLVNNSDNFSEWSTVCLIRGISKPIIDIAPYIDEGKENFTSKTLKVLGNLTFENSEETEILNSYQLFLKDANEKIIEQTNKIYTNILNPNEINHTMKTTLKNDTKYTLIIKYITRNLYETEVSFPLKTSDGGIDFNNLEFLASIDPVLGATNIVINFNNFDQQSNDIFWIKRASIKDNFQTWEYIHPIVNSSYKQIRYVWNDFSIESGVWYKYALEVNRDDKILDTIVADDMLYTILEDIVLMRNYRQLNIKLNPQISSYQRVISDTTTTTLGSKYPFISRNGNSNYRQFSISGLIASQMDETGMFTSKDEIYQLNKNLYAKVNAERNVLSYKDYQYEYLFREKVIDFLYDEKPKLFRSPTEGNIIVRLTNISFTPNQTLGRLVYNFSATAVEIDDCTPENLLKYEIIKANSISDIIDNAFFFVYDYSAEDQLAILPSYSVDDNSLVISTFSTEI